MEEEKQSQFVAIYEGMNQLKKQLQQMERQMKQLEKQVKKEIKSAKKEKQVKKKNPKEPSGFAKPTFVTNELCIFMNKEEGTQLARTECTKALIDYISKNKLQYNENKQVIKPDDNLKTLLGLTDQDELTYFTLQKYMNKHFVKVEKPPLCNE
jgi:chromatin remodeling complex protein RSC6